MFEKNKHKKPPGEFVKKKKVFNETKKEGRKSIYKCVQSSFKQKMQN